MSNHALRNWAVGTATTAAVLGATVVLAPSPAMATHCTYPGCDLYTKNPDGTYTPGPDGKLDGDPGHCPPGGYGALIGNQYLPQVYDSSLFDSGRISGSQAETLPAALLSTAKKVDAVNGYSDGDICLKGWDGTKTDTSAQVKDDIDDQHNGTN